MPLPESYWPKKKMGELSPTSAVDAYEWYYFSIPRGISTAAIPVGMQEFTPKEIQRVFAPAADYARTFKKLGVDLIVQGGVPLPCVMGPDFLDELLGRMHEASGIQTTANVLSMVAGAKRLGLKNIALANKWTDAMNQNLAKFFKRQGIDVAGWSTHVMTPKEFEGMRQQEGLDLSYQLGAAALKQYPEADGLYVGGGSWLGLPSAVRLEEEFGKPVFSNSPAYVRHRLELLGLWKPIPGYVRLLSLE
jgi:maleate cis-trans isomerase